MKAFVFPGQGSQFVGMGKDLANNFLEAKEVFAQVNEALNEDLYKLMTEGSTEDLGLTRNAQPALMAVSMAVVKVIETRGGFKLADKATFVAGHSLGEYSALCAVQAFDIATVAKLLRSRGNAMQRAVPKGIGTMAAILGLNFDKVDEACKKSSSDISQVSIANDNSDGQIVISGHIEAVNKAMALAKEMGAKRAIILDVSGPFHSSLMAPAAIEMAKIFEDVTINVPSIPVVQNVIAMAETNPENIKQNLISQITGRVRWRESVKYMADLGITEIIELGAGKVLSGLAPRIVKGLEAKSIGNVEDINNFLS